MAIYRLSNGLVMKTTRGRMRAPKAGTKQNLPVRSISDEVLWSAMRPRIAFARRNAAACAVLSGDRPREREQRTTNNPPSLLTSILSPWKGEADDKAMRFRVATQSDLGRLASSEEERRRVRSCRQRASRLVSGMIARSLFVIVKRAGRMPARRTARMAVLLACIAPVSISGAAKNRSAMQLPGYRAVSVHYGPMNKMIMSVRINGQPANLLVDTGSNQLILDAEAAELFGVRPSQRAQALPRQTFQAFRYIRYTQIGGELLPVGFAQNISAGGMNFGGSLVTLRSSNHSGNSAGAGHVDGVLGLDLLLRHKALINCRTKLVFFKVDQGRRISLGSVAASEKFTRVPIQREENGALTVRCSIRGQPTRLLVDTGAFVTILHESFATSLGLDAEPTRISAQFGRGASKRIRAARLNDFNIGLFKVPPEKFGVAPLPQFALQQGSSKIAGILGMDTLYICHAIIDLDGMNLFLK
jgi:predicted aspartyl protease